MRHILLIGYGAIAHYVVDALQSERERIGLSLIVRQERVPELRAALPDIEVTDRLDELEEMPELAVECASHKAVAALGEACLTRGCDFLVTSVGALTDAFLLQSLRRAAQTHMGKLLIPSGALAGVDAIAAARYGGLDHVRYSARNPPQAWKGSYAERLTNLDRLSGATTFYRGTAGEAAKLFPQNANVAATLALAGLGFDRTEVTLIADPDAPGNVHAIEAAGAFGSLHIEVTGTPMADNPKTSTLAALSVLRAIHNRTAAIQI